MYYKLNLATNRSQSGARVFTAERGSGVCVCGGGGGGQRRITGFAEDIVQKRNIVRFGTDQVKR